MIFSSNKDNPDGTANAGDDPSISSDTFRRWKEASTKSTAPRTDGTPLASPGDIPAFVGLGGVDMTGETPSPARRTNMKTADWPVEETIRIIDDSVTGGNWGQPQDEKIAPLSSKPSITKTGSSKLAQFMSGLSGAKFGSSEVETKRSEFAPNLTRAFGSAVPGSPIQSQALNSLSVEDRKNLFKEEEQLRSSEDDIRQRFGANLKSALSSGTIIEGKFKFDSPVRIDGTLIGEVQASSLLIVGGDASIEAKVKVGSLVVLGVVKGNVEAEELIEVKRGGVLEGDVKCARFAIEDGGWFQGKVSPTSEPKPRTLGKKVEKISDSPSAAQPANGMRSGSEQLSLGSTSDVAEQSGVKASWSN